MMSNEGRRLQSEKVYCIKTWNKNAMFHFQAKNCRFWFSSTNTTLSEKYEIYLMLVFLWKANFWKNLIEKIEIKNPRFIKSCSGHENTSTSFQVKLIDSLQRFSNPSFRDFPQKITNFQRKISFCALKWPCFKIKLILYDLNSTQIWPW